LNKLYKLINYEFRCIYKNVLAIGLLLILGQNFLLYISSREYLPNGYIPFENLISISGVPIVFYICFTMILASCIYSVLSNYIGSKSIYTLMTLPQNRSYIYLSKLFTGITSILMLIAAQFISIFCGYALFSTSIGTYEDSVLKLEKPVNALFLAFIRSDFLRMLFPLNIESLIYTATIFISIICSIYYVIYGIQARKYIYVGLALINVILIIFVLTYRSNALTGVWKDHNLSIYSALFLLLSVYYSYQSISWIKRGSTLG